MWETVSSAGDRKTEISLELFMNFKITLASTHCVGFELCMTIFNCRFN